MKEDIIHLIRKDCSQLFIFFTAGKRFGLHLSPIDFFKESGIFNRNIMFLRDRERMHFMNGIGGNIDNFKKLIIHFKEFLAASPWIKHVYCAGFSNGSLGSVLAGLHLNAERVYSFAHRPGTYKGPCKYLDEQVSPRSFDLVEILNQQKINTVFEFHFNVFSKDMLGCVKLRGLPNVKLKPYWAYGHNTLLTLNHRKRLNTIFPKFIGV